MGFFLEDIKSVSELMNTVMFPDEDQRHLSFLQGQTEGAVDELRLTMIP